MNKVAALIGLLFALPYPAAAAEHYIALETGTFSPGSTSTLNSQFVPVDIDYGTGWAAGAAIGLRNGAVRTETELVYRQASPDAWALGILANIWLDARNSTRFTPYIGGGVGFARGHAASPGPIENSITGVAYQAGGGLGYTITSETVLDLGYRYFGITSTSRGNSGSDTLVGSSFLVGTRFRF